MDDSLDISQCRHKLICQVNDVLCTFSMADPISKTMLVYYLSFHGCELRRLDHFSTEMYVGHTSGTAGLRRAWCITYNNGRTSVQLK